MTTTQQQRSPIKAAFHAVFSHPLVRWFHTQQRRRGLAIAFLATLASYPLAAWLGGGVPVVIALLIPYAIGSVLLAGATGALFDRPTSTLDERQAHIRSTVFKNPYYTGLAIGLAGGIIVAITTRADDATMTSWFLFVSGLAFSLPYLSLAWKLPDDVLDHE